MTSEDRAAIRRVYDYFLSFLTAITVDGRSESIPGLPGDYAVGRHIVTAPGIDDRLTVDEVRRFMAAVERMEEST